MVEMLVTLVLVSILASAALPMAELVVQRNKEQELRRNLREIRDAIDAWKLAVDEGHILRKAGESGYPPSLDALVQGVIDAKSVRPVKIYFLRRVPRDPFFADPGVPAAETWGKRSYASSFDAPEEGADVYDVYSRSEASGLNTIPYRQW
jgi:general secretion pathway protein G